MDNELLNRIADLEKVVYNHKHTEYDRTPKLPGGIYGGSLNSDGTAVFLPDGWTSTRSAAGTYVITHNLGTTNYAVVANCTTSDISFNGTFMIIDPIDANSFTVNSISPLNLHFVSAQFDFILRVQPQTV